MLTNTIGPTAHVFAAHPRTEVSRFRIALIGHGVAIGAGPGALTAFGLSHQPSVTATRGPSYRQLVAAAFAAVLLAGGPGSIAAPGWPASSRP